MPSNHLTFCRPLLLLRSIFPSIRVFSNESVLCIRWPKYWSFSLEVISSAYLRLLMFLLPILIPAYNSSSPAFLMMCSAYRLNRQGDSRQPCHTPFSILNQSVVPYSQSLYQGSNCRFLTCIRFLRRQVRWSGIPISLELSTVCHVPHSQRL